MKLEQLTEARNLVIHYSYSPSPFGQILVASAGQGVCYLAFVDEEAPDIPLALQEQFPEAHLLQKTDTLQQQALAFFQRDGAEPAHIKLYVKGTAFQLQVWESLLKIPRGTVTTYGEIAQQIGRPGASRAVGSAVGSNPVAFLIPCHRVIRRDGSLGGYHWGQTRKAAILGWEAVGAE